ncbi:MAG: hypothetical protein F6K26_02745 [Moorea sp. SIO2I5]|nr:hypothetical protein [Moorena sp. SIO2I5]
MGETPTRALHQDNERRLLTTICLVTLAYSLATLQGEYFENIGASEYICRPGDET